MAKKSKKGESPRSETLSVRFTPKIKYGAELLARKQHRTLAGVVEWAVEESIKEVLPLLQEVWSVDESERTLLLAEKAPHLLTYEEEVWLKEFNRD